MKTSLPLLILFVLCSGVVSAQQYMFGKVTTEENVPLSGIQIVNMRTEVIAVSDTKGLFMIAAETGDRIRVVSSRFNRQEFRTSASSFAQPVEITMIRPEVEIPEVKIAFVPSGNLPKDVKALNTPARVQKLHAELNTYMQKPLAAAEPQLSMPKTLVMGPNFSAGQVNVLGLVAAAAGLVQKAVTPKPVIANYYDTEAFYAEVRTKIDRKYFTDYGLDDFRFDELVAYANERYNLATKYRNNFDKIAITSYLKMALKDFLMLQESGPSSSRSAAETEEAAA